MPEPTHSPSKVTLENLLRLKRHERPGTEFWARFDRELQERSLRELMEPVPSRWHWLEVLLGRRMAWMTTGATAALVMSFAWHGTVNRSIAPAAHTVVATVQPLTPTTTVAANIPSAIVQAAAPAADETRQQAQPQYVVTTLSPSPEPASNQKVPATLAFAADASSGTRFPADALVDVALTSRIKQSAY